MSAPAKKDRAASRRQTQAKDATSSLANIYSFVANNLTLILQVSGAIMAVLFAYVIYQSGQLGVKNLINAKPEVLKEAIFGEYPHLFYCHTGKGGDEPVVPPVFTDLNKLRGSRMSFAMLNCRYTLMILLPVFFIFLHILFNQAT